MKQESINELRKLSNDLTDLLGGNYDDVIKDFQNKMNYHLDKCEGKDTKKPETNHIKNFF